MLDEALTCLRGLWSGEPFTFTGEFYRFENATMPPRPVQRPYPPILLGGSGRGLLRIAARHADELNIISDVGRAGYIALANTRKFDDASFRAKVAFVHEEAKRAGRDGDRIAISTAVFTTIFTDSPAATRATAGQMGAMFGGTDAVLASPLFLIGTPAEMVAELRRRRTAWGLTEVILSFAGEDVLRRFGEEVLPHL